MVCWIDWLVWVYQQKVCLGHFVSFFPSHVFFCPACFSFPAHFLLLMWVPGISTELGNKKYFQRKINLNLHPQPQRHSSNANKIKAFELRIILLILNFLLSIWGWYVLWLLYYVIFYSVDLFCLLYILVNHANVNFIALNVNI